MTQYTSITRLRIDEDNFNGIVYEILIDEDGEIIPIDYTEEMFK